jgi:hypothetical protein
MFLDGKDVEILAVVNNYFAAIRDRWPEAWDDRGRGAVLNRTNGVRALLRFIRNAYLKGGVPGDVVATSKFLDRVFKPIQLKDSDFTVENFPPGTSGESKLFRILRGQETL